MSGRFFTALLLIGVFAVGACAPRASDRAMMVDREAVPSFQAGTVTVRAFPREMNDSLDYKTHRPALEAGLIDAGLEIASRDNARYIAFLTLDAVTGPGGRDTAMLQLASFGAPPSDGADPGLRVVSLRIVEAKAPGRTVFAASAAAPASCAQTPDTVRAMIAAVLSRSPAPRLAC